jgi:hypothetical protein
MDWMWMYSVGVKALLLLSAAIFTALLFITAPYGRHYRKGFGPDMNARAGWVVMESPAVLVFLWVYGQGSQAWAPVPLLLLALWQAHYVQRTFIFPFLMRFDGKHSPLMTVALGFLFNSINAALNAYWISHAGTHLTQDWPADPRFLGGVGLFVVGYAINRQSDGILRSLRRPGEQGYRIPFGGCFRWVTSPNYLGELLEWVGWTLATWSVAGLAFACFTAANLVPRARAHHRWYQQQFPDYPPERKVILPGLY